MSPATTGDGLLVYFGYPKATEHGAESAIRAGLEIVDNVRRLRLGPEYALHTRIGIASGEVVVGDVVGDGPSRETTVVGATPNLAARLQEICAPDTVVISGHTHDLVRRLFEYSDLGYHKLKGFNKPVHVYTVIGESPWRAGLRPPVTAFPVRCWGGKGSGRPCRRVGTRPNPVRARS